MQDTKRFNRAKAAEYMTSKDKPNTKPVDLFNPYEFPELALLKKPSVMQNLVEPPKQKMNLASLLKENIEQEAAVRPYKKQTQKPPEAAFAIVSIGSLIQKREEHRVEEEFRKKMELEEEECNYNWQISRALTAFEDTQEKEIIDEEEEEEEEDEEEEDITKKEE